MGNLTARFPDREKVGSVFPRSGRNHDQSAQRPTRTQTNPVCRHVAPRQALSHFVREALRRGLRQATRSAPRTATLILSPYTHTRRQRDVSAPRPALLQAPLQIDFMAEAEAANCIKRQSPASLRADITSIWRSKLQNDDVRSDDEKRKVSAPPPVTAPLITAHPSPSNNPNCLSREKRTCALVSFPRP